MLSVSLTSITIADDGGTNHFEVTLFSDGKIKFQYKDMTPNPNAWAEPSVGVENAGGSEGMQISYADPQFPRPNTAFVVGKTCGRSKTMFSVGWCPNYCPGSDAANCPGVTLANTCDQEYGDRFCQDNCKVERKFSVLLPPADPARCCLQTAASSLRSRTSRTTTASSVSCPTTRRRTSSVPSPATRNTCSACTLTRVAAARASRSGTILTALPLTWISSLATRKMV